MSVNNATSRISTGLILTLINPIVLGKLRANAMAADRTKPKINRVPPWPALPKPAANDLAWPAIVPDITACAADDAPARAADRMDAVLVAFAFDVPPARATSDPVAVLAARAADDAPARKYP